MGHSKTPWTDMDHKPSRSWLKKVPPHLQTACPHHIQWIQMHIQLYLNLVPYNSSPWHLGKPTERPPRGSQADLSSEREARRGAWLGLGDHQPSLMDFMSFERAWMVVIGWFISQENSWTQERLLETGKPILGLRVNIFFTI